jgi:hypothetical protein
MENEEESEIKKMSEIRSADWTESNKFDPIPNIDANNSNNNSYSYKNYNNNNNNNINTIEKNNNDNINNINNNNINNNNDDDDNNDILRDSISLRYYIRVLVQDAAGRSCWDTTEIKLYRGGRHISILPVAAAIPDV